MKRADVHLQLVLVDVPFMKWVLDVIGRISIESNQGHSYIVTATDYFTKW